MPRCACSPGTEANGWHQQWCDACLADEMRQWAQTMSRWAEKSEGLLADFLEAADGA